MWVRASASARRRSPAQEAWYYDQQVQAARLFCVSVLALLIAAASAGAATAARYCWPGVTIPRVTIPAVTIPAVTIPAVTIPRTCFNGVCVLAHHYPAQHYATQHYPAQHFPAQHIRGDCFKTAAAFAPWRTTVRVRNYRAIDPTYSPQLSTRYWSAAGIAVISVPNPYAPGFGQFNAAGFPKNQYVRPYVRSDGTLVHGYWRNSPADGLPTCRIISC